MSGPTSTIDDDAGEASVAQLDAVVTQATLLAAQLRQFPNGNPLSGAGAKSSVAETFEGLVESLKAIGNRQIDRALSSLPRAKGAGLIVALDDLYQQFGFPTSQDFGARFLDDYVRGENQVVPAVQLAMQPAFRRLMCRLVPLNRSVLGLMITDFKNAVKDFGSELFSGNSAQSSGHIQSLSSRLAAIMFAIDPDDKRSTALDEICNEVRSIVNSQVTSPDPADDLSFAKAEFRSLAINAYPGLASEMTVGAAQ